jgi:selenide,water dikinase
LVYTLDVITPIVDDPRAFGRIAAANALSDVYAMGGHPQVALSFVGMPASLGLDVVHEVMWGMAEKAKEARCAVVGGHTIKDSEPKSGLAVIGSVDRDAVWTHRGGKAGQRLVLTKPVGTGVVAQAIKKDAAEPEWIDAASRSMERLNDAACEAGKKHGATAATDVTGFGLLGHLSHLAEASSVAANIHTEKVPLLPGAYRAAEAGYVPGGSKRNLSYVRERLDGFDGVDPTLLQLLVDAQTSGGLLLCLAPDDAERVCEELAGANIIGELVDGNPGTIHLV